jgi:CRISPR system Cascade subunit CasC
MRLIELHILQSFPVSCLNRDDVGSPKTAVFGGATRSRVSSQCLKRAIREHAQRQSPSLFAGNRSRLIIDPLAERFRNLGVHEPHATEVAKQIGDHLATLDAKAEKEGVLKVKTLMFLSPLELDSIAEELVDFLKEGSKAKDLAKGVAKACKKALLKDAADIAIFGRMAASDPSLTLEGAAMFGHALSTHKAENDIDFFSAVDDLQKAEEVGAGMTGILEFSSATYYRYAGLNLDLLSDENHLGALAQQERAQVVDTFLRSTVLAVPGARKNSMNAHTLPAYVLGIVKERGQPLQLVNAFEEPIYSKNGLVKESIEKLKHHHQALKNTWNIETVEEVSIPDVDLATFCKELVSYVR